MVKTKAALGFILLLVSFAIISATRSKFPSVSSRTNVEVLESSRIPVVSKPLVAQVPARRISALSGRDSVVMNERAPITNELYDNPEKTADPFEVERRDREEASLHEIQHASF